ncbi:MAG: restriction endonuclease subunit S, partial [Chryseobacterium sp.]
KTIEELNAFKKGIAKKIFSQQLRFKDDNGNYFPEWESKMLGEVLDYEQPTKYLVSTTEYDDSFKTPVVTAGKTFILGYTNEEENIFEKEKLPVIIFDDFTTASQFVDFPFKAKSSAMKILKAQKGNDVKFIFEAMQMISYEIGGHGRHWISVFSNLEISLPTLSEQQKVASFLSSIDTKIDIENQILQKLEEQKKYFLANLFI